MTNTIDSLHLRNVAGAFATGIAVITIVTDQSEVVGMTINSFLSVSLDPPLVLFSAENTSNLLPFLGKDLKISIHILSEDQKSLSDYFAGNSSLTDEFNLKIEGDLINIEDAMAGYHLKIQSLIPAGDHNLVLCEIIKCWRSDHKQPIIFYDGYRTTGNLIISE